MTSSSNFSDALDVTLLTSSSNFSGALDATLLTSSSNFSDALDATRWTSSSNFSDALDATLFKSSSIFNEGTIWFKASHRGQCACEAMVVQNVVQVFFSQRCVYEVDSNPDMKESHLLGNVKHELKKASSSELDLEESKNAAIDKTTGKNQAKSTSSGWKSRRSSISRLPSYFGLLSKYGEMS